MNMNFPDNLHYTRGHEWILREGRNALVGITSFAQQEFGEILYLDTAVVGTILEKDTVFGTIEALKAVSDLYIPFGGKLVNINTELYDNPALINEDPYGKGWIINVELTDIADIDNLLSANEYKRLIGR